MESSILVVTEGEVEEIRVLGSKMHGLFSLVSAKYNIVPVCGSIYELYEEYKEDEYFDIVSYLVEKGQLKLEEGEISKTAFSAIYLLFDLDPHYQKYSPEKIIEMQQFFDDETDRGKLYISYPMIESYYYFKSIPDKEFLRRKIDLNNFTGKGYKKLVHECSCIKKNKLSTKELKYIIKEHYDKILYLLHSNTPDCYKILKMQLREIEETNSIYVLSTIPIMLFDYNNDLAMKIVSGEK